MQYKLEFEKCFFFSLEKLVFNSRQIHKNIAELSEINLIHIFRSTIASMILLGSYLPLKNQNKLKIK